MRLTAQSIPHYLIDKGFMDMDVLLNGEYMLTQTQSRNSIFQVSQGEKSGLFVKQLVHMDPQNTYLMQKDATTHYLIHQTNVYPALKQYVPEYYGYDTKRNVFVTEYLPYATSMHEWATTNQKLSSEQAIKVAEILHSFHHSVVDEIPKVPSLQFFNSDQPWILKMTQSHMQFTDNVFGVLLKDDFLCEQVDKIQEIWSNKCLIHGDIKLVNFLVCQEEENIKLIDWEIANLGDPLWDVASFLQSYLFMKISYLSHTPEGWVLPKHLEYWDTPAQHQALTGFWKTYAKLQKWNPKEEEEALSKTLRYVAARLLQSAKEMNQNPKAALSPQTYIVIQTAKNIFHNPLYAAKDIFGLEIKTS